MTKEKPHKILLFMLLCGLFLYACDALVSSGDSGNNPSLPEGERNLEVLTETQWISLPDQKISGIPVSPRWHTANWTRLDDHIDEDMALSGQHYYIWEDQLRRGNQFYKKYELKEYGSLKPIGQGIGTSLKLTQVSEIFIFAFIDDWVISADGNLYLKYPHYDEESDEMFIYVFEPFTEEHELCEQITGCEA